MAGHGQDVAGRGLDAGEVPLVDAARLLNTTPEALRKRLQRGKSIRGTKRDGEWYVRLPAAVASRGQDAGSPPPGRVLDATRDTAGYGQDVSTPLVDELRHQRAQLEEQMAAMRQQLAAAEVERSELRRLLALALQTRALPAPRDDPSPSDGPGHRPWWTALLWWRR
jgi:hypothetical protein